MGAANRKSLQKPVESRNLPKNNNGEQRRNKQSRSVSRFARISAGAFAAAIDGGAALCRNQWRTRHAKSPARCPPGLPVQFLRLRYLIRVEVQCQRKFLRNYVSV
jgi:hypothetical protein